MDHKIHSSAKPIPIPSTQETGKARDRESNLIVGSIQSDWDVIAEYDKIFNPPSPQVENPEGILQAKCKESVTGIK